MVETIAPFVPLILKGALMTIAVAIVSVALSIFFGFLGAALKLSESPILRVWGELYTTIIRGIPDLVLMLIIFFGGQMLVNELIALIGYDGRLEVSRFAAGCLSIGIIFGAYMTEAFRGAFLSISKGQIEAAKSFGMNRRTWLTIIVWPQFVPLVLPAFTNNWLVLMKTTALVSIIGLQDLTYTALRAGRTTGEPFLFLLVAITIYLILTVISDIGLRRVERHYVKV